MAVRKDILFDNDGQYDLAIRNGDLAIGQSDLQHIHHLLELAPAQLRQYPLLGVGIREWIHGNVTGVEKKKVSQNLRVDGYSPTLITYRSGQLKIRI